MCRTLVWGLMLLVPLPAAWSQETNKTDDKGTKKITGKLSPDDPKDKVMAKSPHQVHTMKMKAGKTYQIDLVSRAFDSFLRLEDSAGKELAKDDDGGGFPNARIVFKAPKDDTYRIIVTNLDSKTGDYTLTIARGSAAAAALASVQADFQKSLQPVQQAYAKAKTQQEKDRIVSEFYDSAAPFVARYAKIAQQYPGDNAGMQAMNMVTQNLGILEMSKSPAAAKTLGELTKMLRDLAEHATNESIQAQAGAALGQVLRNMYEKAYEKKDGKAEALYEEAEKTLTALSKKQGGRFADALFELQKLSVGKAAPEIEGEDLDGKEFKLSDYRGKVVVLDFWGNW
jgi:hypothetical protein